VGVARLEPARQRDPRELAALEGPEQRSYRIPEPHVTLFPGVDRQSAGAIQTEGQRFFVHVPLDDEGRPGRYQISVWGRHPGNEKPVIVSLRTIDVRVRR
jgi:hypothetical protein